MLYRRDWRQNAIWRPPMVSPSWTKPQGPRRCTRGHFSGGSFSAPNRNGAVTQRRSSAL